MELPSFIVTRAVYAGLLDRVKRFINRRRDPGYSNPTEFIKEAISRYLNELEFAEKLSSRKEAEQMAENPLTPLNKDSFENR